MNHSMTAVCLVACGALVAPAFGQSSEYTGFTVAPTSAWNTRHAPQIEATFPQPGSVVMSATADGCHNNPGPFITLDGEITLGGINARVILTNNRRFTHVTSQDVTADAVLLEAGESIRFAKQPPLGGAGGNPHIYVWFHDCEGNYFTEAPSLLGRCVQGLSPTALHFTLPTDASVLVGGSCSNNPGPFITLDGSLSLGGLCATLIFTNNANFTHVHEEDVTAEVVILDAGETLTFHKQPPLDGAGGNPLVYVQFLDGASQPLGDPIFVGRCNRL